MAALRCPSNQRLWCPSMASLVSRPRQQLKSSALQSLQPLRTSRFARVTTCAFFDLNSKMRPSRQVRLESLNGETVRKRSIVRNHGGSEGRKLSRERIPKIRRSIAWKRAKLCRNTHPIHRRAPHDAGSNDSLAMKNADPKVRDSFE